MAIAAEEQVSYLQVERVAAMLGRLAGPLSAILKIGARQMNDPAESASTAGIRLSGQLPDENRAASSGSVSCSRIAG